jgi:hypothetical protein
MDTRYAVQHRTRKDYLACTPSLGLAMHTTPNEADAASWSTKALATFEMLELGDFATTWEVVPVQREMMSSRHTAGKQDASITADGRPLP